MITGNLQKKGNVWYAVINQANRKQKWISTKSRGKTDAQKVLRDIISQMENDSYVDNSRITFISMMEEWLENTCKMQIETTTYDGYKLIFKAHIKEYFDSTLLLQQLKTIQLQKYFDEKAKSGNKRNGEGLSGNTLRKHKILLKCFFDYAVKMNIISKTPITNVTLPKMDKFIGKYYTADQLEQLLNCVKGTLIETPVLITSFYGLRRGEILGLRWEDIDFKEGSIKICNTRTRVGETTVNKAPKNESSLRTLPMIDNVNTYLKQLLKKQKENKLLMGNEFKQSEYICCWENGQMYDISLLNHQFKKILEDNSMPHIRFHDLRHSTASYLLKQGFSLKEIQVWLGHSNINTTANIYSHIDIEMKMNMATKMNSIAN